MTDQLLSPTRHCKGTAHTSADVCCRETRCTSGRRFQSTVDDTSTLWCSPLRLYRNLPESFQCFRAARTRHKCLSQHTCDDDTSLRVLVLINGILIRAFSIKSIVTKNYPIKREVYTNERSTLNGELLLYRVTFNWQSYIWPAYITHLSVTYKHICRNNYPLADVILKSSIHKTQQFKIVNKNCQQDLIMTIIVHIILLFNWNLANTCRNTVCFLSGVLRTAKYFVHSAPLHLSQSAARWQEQSYKSYNVLLPLLLLLLL